MAPGAAAGDLLAEEFARGDIATGPQFDLIIASITFGWVALKRDGIPAF